MKTMQTKTDPNKSHFANQSSGKESFFPSESVNKNSFFSPAYIQPKLKIGAPDDKYEQQADRVADAVVNSSVPGIQKEPVEEEEILQMKTESPVLQKKCSGCEEEENLQMKGYSNQSGGSASSEISQQVQNSGGGNQLSSSVNREMSQKIGVDFSDVTIHTGSQAAEFNQSLGARAFTHGSDIYFNSGEYNPGSTEGKRLLAHELTHVVQQTSSIQRQPATGTDIPEVKTNPMVGLTRGDGLVYGTFEKRPRVKLLQHRLNEKTFSGLDIDGMFGSLTTEALNNFQLRIGSVPTETVDSVTADALTDEKKIDPVEPEIPQPELPEFPGDVWSCSAVNLELEDIMNVILVKHNFYVPLYLSALDRLEKDLSELETPGNIAKDILVFIIKGAFDVIFGSTLGGELKELVKKGLKEANTDEADQKFIVDGVIAPVYKAANDAAKDATSEAVGNLMDKEPISLSNFIDTKKAGVINAASTASEDFGIKGKANLRKLQSPEDLEDCLIGVDPRVIRARKLLQAMNNQENDAFITQYRESLRSWALLQAHTKLGTVPSMVFGSDARGTDLSKNTKGVAGILHLEFPVEDPAKVTVSRAEILGLSSVVRSKLEKQNPSIRGLHLPVVARGKSGFLMFGGNDIEIAENERGDIFNNTKKDNDWLAARAMIDAPNSPPELVKSLTAFEGARLILQDDIMPTKLSKIPGGLRKL